MGMVQLEWTGVRKTLGITVALVGFALLVTSCYPGGPTDVADLDIVTTVRASDDSVYAGNKTFALPDTVIQFFDSTETNPPTIDRSNDADILAAIRAGMKSLGYKEVPFDTTFAPPIPDVVMLAQVTATNNWSAYGSYPWYGWWGGWGGWGYWPGYGPGWGAGYPPYGGVTFVNYETGTLFIDMHDPDLRDEEEMITTIIWNGTVSGLLGSSALTTTERLDRDIKQAFTQSEYLRVKP